MKDILNLLISAPSRLIRVSLGTRIDKTRWALVYWFLRHAAQQVLRSDCRTAAVTVERASRMEDISNLLISNVGATPYYMAIVTGRTHAHSSDLLVLIACNIARDCALVASL